MKDTVRNQLLLLKDSEYQKFNSKLLPGIGNRIIGVRIPELRKYAKKLAGSDFRQFLDIAENYDPEDSWHEELMLWGMVLGYAKMETEERRRRLEAFVPVISNWAVCDSCITSFTFMKEDREYWYEFLLGWKESREEYELRFLIVSLMYYYMDEEHIDELLQLYSEIRHEGYYVRMGVAWALSMCYIKFPEKVRELLENNDMDDFTHNKTIQKIRESYRVSREEKESLKKLKRKK